MEELLNVLTKKSIIGKSLEEVSKYFNTVYYENNNGICNIVAEDTNEIIAILTYSINHFDTSVIHTISFN